MTRGSLAQANGEARTVHMPNGPNANQVVLFVTPFAVDKPSAAAMLGMSLRHFETHVQPSLKLVYSGRLRLVPVRELERWVEANATSIGGAS